MGGSTHTAGRLAYLPINEAADLRVRLLELAAASREGSASKPTRSDDERVLTTTPTARLFVSLVLSDGSLQLLIVLLPAAVLFGVGASAGYVLLAGATLWRRFNGDYRLTVAEGPDGLRLRGGLVATTAETIPRGRVQAVRMIEPFLWRPFGWCRLQVEIAGHQQSKGEASSESRRAHTLLPVGNRTQVSELLPHLLLELPTQRLRPPRRARWKTPLRYHNLAWGRTDGCVVTTSGRLTRVTTWVPLAKAQSLRLVRGPVQKSLRLATIHVDVAGRGVRAALRDRDRVEADEVLAELVTLCRRARHSQSIASRPA
jgi:putative membrane protein